MHGAQEAAASSAAKVPAVQLLQTDLAAREKEPFLHGRHTAVPPIE
jgi:hypothetical protein